MDDAARHWWSPCACSANLGVLPRISGTAWCRLLLSTLGAVATLVTLVCLWTPPQPRIAVYCCKMTLVREFCLTIPLDADKNSAGDFYTKLPRKFDLANGRWFCSLTGFSARHSWPDLRHVSYGQHLDIVLEGNNNLKLDVSDFGRFTPEDLTAAIDRTLERGIAFYQRIADEYKTEVQKCMQEAVKSSQDKGELKSKLRDCDEEKRSARSRRRILAKH